MNTFKSAAVEILKKSGKPLHYGDIARLAIEAGLLTTEGATPEATMGSQLFRDVKYKNKGSDFVRTGAGIFGLNKNKVINEKILEVEQKVQEEDLEEVENVKVESSYTGKGGEYLVCSELLFRGFNASIMGVDVGSDIVATKENKLWLIQVKTSNLSKLKVYVFDVRKVSFERKEGGNIFYIFVLHGSGKNDFLILPYHEMEKKVHERAILEVDHGKRYRINIKFRNGKIYLGTMDHAMDYYLNNWEIIK